MDLERIRRRLGADPQQLVALGLIAGWVRPPAPASSLAANPSPPPNKRHVTGPAPRFTPEELREHQRAAVRRNNWRRRAAYKAAGLTTHGTPFKCPPH